MAKPREALDRGAERMSAKNTAAPLPAQQLAVGRVGNVQRFPVFSEVCANERHSPGYPDR